MDFLKTETDLLLASVTQRCLKPSVRKMMYTRRAEVSARTCNSRDNTTTCKAKVRQNTFKHKFRVKSVLRQHHDLLHKTMIQNSGPCTKCSHKESIEYAPTVKGARFIHGRKSMANSLPECFAASSTSSHLARPSSRLVLLLLPLTVGIANSCKKKSSHEGMILIFSPKEVGNLHVKEDKLLLSVVKSASL